MKKNPRMKILVLMVVIFHESFSWVRPKHLTHDVDRDRNAGQSVHLVKLHWDIQKQKPVEEIRGILNIPELQVCMKNCPINKLLL